MSPKCRSTPQVQRTGEDLFIARTAWRTRGEVDLVELYAYQIELNSGICNQDYQDLIPHEMHKVTA